MQAILKHIRISPLKLRVIGRIIRKKNVLEALDILDNMPKKGAKILYKVVKSAAYNAKNNFGQKLDTLIISALQVDKGMAYKRGVPRSRGRVAPITKPTSNVKIEVMATVSDKPAKAPKKVTKATKK